MSLHGAIKAMRKMCIRTGLMNYTPNDDTKKMIKKFDDNFFKHYKTGVLSPADISFLNTLKSKLNENLQILNDLRNNHRIVSEIGDVSGAAGRLNETNRIMNKIYITYQRQFVNRINNIYICLDRSQKKQALPVEDFQAVQNEINRDVDNHPCDIQESNQNHMNDSLPPHLQGYTQLDMKDSLPPHLQGYTQHRGGKKKVMDYKKYLNKQTVERIHQIAMRKKIKITKKHLGKTVYLKKNTIIKKLCDLKKI